MAMIAITTSSSISVKADRFDLLRASRIRSSEEGEKKGKWKSPTVVLQAIAEPARTETRFQTKSLGLEMETILPITNKKPSK
jgi:hypothetical protein